MLFFILIFITVFSTLSNSPKAKYLISLYQSKNLYIIACFTTSQSRAGRLLDSDAHGVIKNKNQEIISYVFSPKISIGTTIDEKKFFFKKQTIIRFDYCFKEGYQDELLSKFQSPKVVGKLNDKEYKNLIYAMYKSNDTPEKYKPYFETILSE